MDYIDLNCFGPRSYAALQSPHDPCLSLPDSVRVPQPCTVTESGEACLRLYYPNAQRVEVLTAQGLLPLHRENGFWTLTQNLGKGYVSLVVLVDGNQVLSPFLPIGFADNRPANFLEIPDGDPWREVRDVPHGVLCSDFVQSPITHRTERITVYLPPQYFTQPERRFPALYLQHGFGENETVWASQGKINFVLDNLLAAGLCEPMLVVMCNGMQIEWTPKESRTHYDEFPLFLAGTVLPHIESRYRVPADAAHRAVAGLSMGSIQASRTAFTYPELFRAVGLFSGFVADPLVPESAYLTAETMAAFQKAEPLFFRAMGENDIFFACFQNDDALLEQNGIPCTRKVYQGAHEWNVWYKCIEDFVQLLFKN